MKNILFYLFSLLTVTVISQNRPVLYDFTEVPQSLMLNPGVEVNYNWHIGVPGLSGVSLDVGLNDFKVKDLFANDGLDINDKLGRLIFKLTPSAHVAVNEKIELLSVGMRLPNGKDYLSFGFYEEFDFIAYYPKDFAIFLFEGNTQIDRVFNAESFNLKTDLIGVFHIGINRRVNDQLTLGTRFKLYSSAFEIKSTNNSGLFFTTKGINNIYRHNLQDIDLSFKTAGLFDKNDYDEDFHKKLFSRLFLGGNIGFGLDFGLTYTPTEHFKLTASVQDFGFILNSKNVTEFRARGSFTTEGVTLETPIISGINYFQRIIDDLRESIDTKTVYDSNISFRSPKINASISHSFGLPHYEDCFKPKLDDPYRNQIGVQLFSIFRPKQPQIATTAFYYRRINKYLRTKLTYTVDSYTASSIGFGLSSHYKHFNIYGSFNNLLGSSDFYSSNYNGFQFGMNVIY